MFRNVKILLLICIFGAGLSVKAQSVKFSPENTFIRMNVVVKSPVVDGKISEGEYFGAFENFGFLKHNNSFLASRQGKCFLSFDKKYLYWAMQTELPDDGSNVELLSRYKRRDSKIHSDDNVELLFSPPDGKFIYQLIINPDNFSFDWQFPLENDNAVMSKKINWNPDLLIKSSFNKKMWTVEVRIPLADIAMTDPAGKWKFQFGRLFRNPSQQVAFNKVFSFFNINRMNTVEVLKNTPSVRFLSLGEKYRSGNNELKFIVDNPTGETQTVKYSITITSEAAPRQKEGTLVLAPRSSKDVILAFKEKSRTNNDLKIIFRNSKDEIIYLRNMNWAYPLESRWQAEILKNSAELEFGIYPYYNKVRVRFGNQNVPCDMRNIKSAVVYLTDDKNKKVGLEYVPEIIKNVGYKAEFPLNINKKGEYFVVLKQETENGKSIIHKQKFEFNKFEWEHNKLGLDRIVLPPYTALKYDNDKVKTLLAQYTLKNGFFSAVKSGRATALLAEPVQFSVNGRNPVEKSFRWMEKSPDYGVCLSELELDNLKLQVKNEFEFDNFTKTTLTVDPGSGFEFKKMTLDIPLNADFVQQIHTTCNTMRYNAVHTLPVKNGEVWNSAMGKIHSTVSNNFRPYIWLGKLGEGMAFFAENDKNWSRNPEKPMAQVIRDGKKVVLRINFMDKAVMRHKPFQIVFGFQATPTRIRPNASRQYTDRIKAPNSLVCTVFAGSPRWSARDFDFFPLNKDYSGITAMSRVRGKKYDRAAAKKFVDEYMKRNSHMLPQDKRDFFGRVMNVGFSFSSFSDRIIPYMNPRATHLRWEEFRVFMNEWFCADYRAGEEDDYNNTPTASYQDYLLFCVKKILDAGMDGIYYDNIRDWQNPNSVTGPAYTLDNGRIQPYFDIFDMRKLIKRTAVLLYKEGKTVFDGRPLFVLHMTNTNIVPFTSLCGTTLECEDKYGNTDFQTRFSEDYLRACALGLQSGAIPEILLMITGNNDWVGRTFFAVTSVYDINAVMALSGLPQKPYYVLTSKLKKYGYGTDDVAVYPCYDMSGNIRSDADVRIAEYLHRDGSRVVVISSFGYFGKVKLDFNFTVGRVIDFEDDSEIANNSEKSFSFDLKKHNFRIFKFEKVRKK